MEVDEAVLYEFIADAARDANPLKDGYQVSVVYLALCLLVPKAMGFVGAAIWFVVEKIVRRGNLKE